MEIIRGKQCSVCGANVKTTEGEKRISSYEKHFNNLMESYVFVKSMLAMMVEADGGEKIVQYPDKHALESLNISFEVVPAKGNINAAIRARSSREDNPNAF